MKKALVMSQFDIFHTLDLFARITTFPITIGEFTGIIGERFYNIEPLLASRHTCETNPNYLQLIPYITLRDSATGKVFIYTRGQAGDEGRLRGKCSIGVGGHVDILPDSKTSLKEVLINEALREIEEEVGIKYSTMPVEVRDDIVSKLLEEAPNFTFIYNNTDEVGKVHFGLSIVIDVTPEELSGLEEGHITNSMWMTLDELEKETTLGNIELEKWSDIVLDLLKTN